MTTPYYRDDNVTVHAGDCLDVLKTLADNSVDSVVTDPPYGLEFMGKEWDAPWAKRAGIGGHSAGFNTKTYKDGSTAQIPNYTGNTNPTCRNCGGLRSGRDTKKGQPPCRCDAPQFDNVILPRMVAYQSWCQSWATECLRVLKPGAFIVAFGGTRTFHRLACAIEDAGFEIRDSIGYGHYTPTLLAWVQGSGFPKSLNVSTSLAAIPPCACRSAGTTSQSVGIVNPAGPSGSVGTSIRTELRPVAATGIPTDDTYRVRPQMVTGRSSDNGLLDMDARDEPISGQRFPEMLWPLTVTPTAQSQQVISDVGGVEINPETLRDQVMDEQPVSGAAVGADAIAGDDAGRDLDPSASFVLPLSAAPSGILGTGEPRSIADAHAIAGTVDGGVSPTAKLITADSADMDTVTGTFHTDEYATERLSRCEVCGGRIGDVPAGLGTALKPSWEPIIVARKPIQGTVAANVLAYGTGALNIDGCRVAHNEPPGRPQRGMAGRNGGQYGSGGTPSYRERETDSASPAGRWPPNVTLDPAAAAELDKQSGPTGSWSPRGRANYTRTGDGSAYIMPETETTHYGDYGGGASRFFPTFRYTAKAATTERPTADGIQHPTVKPLELIRWLVRLVTPPHGTVLDPFAGTGTTGEAAIHEHKHAILIEREPTYLPIIRARLHKPIQTGFDFDQPAAPRNGFHLDGDYTADTMFTRGGTAAYEPLPPPPQPDEELELF